MGRPWSLVITLPPLAAIVLMPDEEVEVEVEVGTKVAGKVKVKGKGEA
jgi:hypothetical protein